jgi:formate hydrogenlyase transcriptional activator
MGATKDKLKSTTDGLRSQAEKRLRAKKAKLPLPRSKENTLRLVHELEVHQIELEMQNAELKRAQEELELSRNKYVELYDFAPVGYFTSDAEGKILEVNLTGAKLMGVERQGLIKKSFAVFIADADGKEQFLKHCKMVFQTKGDIESEIRLKKKDGTDFWVRLQSMAVENIDGKAELIHTTIVDITKRKLVEEALRDSEKIYRAIGESIEYGIWICAPDGRNIYTSKSFLKLVGLTQQQCSDFGWGDAMDPADAKRTIAAWKECVRKEGIWDIEHHFRGVDGKIHPVLARGVPVRNDSGEIICWAGINLDISHIKRTEEALQKASDEMGQRVEERTASLKSALSEIKKMKEHLEAENIYFRQEHKTKHQFENIIGQSDGLKYVLYRAQQVAPGNTTILILGETGTGKELIAAAIHDMSPRKEKPLITVNCAALPGNLIESELFGREKGAFTGADVRRMGRFEIANGSTLCLDEIGELPLELQGKLLRVIQHSEFERLGSSQTIKVDVRIIATTNRNLEAEVRHGRFRQDLYYRLNVFPITVPPLRLRKDDIPLMVQAFVDRYSRKLGKQITKINNETIKVLQDYPWPGNVRELESIIERAVILCPGPVLQLADKLEISSPVITSAMRSLEDLERSQIIKILTETKWRIEGKDGAAIILGIHPSTLRARLHKLEIVRPETKKPD